MTEEHLDRLLDERLDRRLDDKLDRRHDLRLEKKKKKQPEDFSPGWVWNITTMMRG